MDQEKEKLIQKEIQTSIANIARLFNCYQDEVIEIIHDMILNNILKIR